MIALAGSITIWLIGINVLLGVAVLLCRLLIAWNVVSNIRQMKKEKREEASVPADYLEKLRDLGVTISADEEKIDEMKEV